MNGKEAKVHLLAVMNCANDSPSTLNSSYTKGQCWNIMFSAVKDYTETDIVNDLVVSNILKEFPDYMRCDFVLEEAPQDKGNEKLQPIKANIRSSEDPLPF